MPQILQVSEDLEFSPHQAKRKNRKTRTYSFIIFIVRKSTNLKSLRIMRNARSINFDNKKDNSPRKTQDNSLSIREEHS